MSPISHNQTHPSQTVSHMHNTDTVLLARGCTITRAGCGMTLMTGCRTHYTASARDCEHSLFNARASPCWLHILIHSWDPVQCSEGTEYLSLKIRSILYYRPQSFRKCALFDCPSSFSGK